MTRLPQPRRAAPRRAPGPLLPDARLGPRRRRRRCRRPCCARGGAFARFEGRSSPRAWLYRIATNACLDAIGRRRRRVLPADHGPAADPPRGRARRWSSRSGSSRIRTSGWGCEDGLAAPEARYEQRESVELAFTAALQHLPARQRATLIFRDVLGFSARETAEALETTVASANSALQRARVAVDERLPEASQQATLRALGDEALRDDRGGLRRGVGARRRRDDRRDAQRGGRGGDAADGHLVPRPRGGRGLPPRLGVRPALARLALRARRAARAPRPDPRERTGGLRGLRLGRGRAAPTSPMRSRCSPCAGIGSTTSPRS